MSDGRARDRRQEEESVPRMRTEITIEDREILVVKRRHYVIREHCARCGFEVSMIAPSHAALLACRDLETVYSWMRTGKVHLSSERSSEKSFVCLNSLLKA
jgi:hypothetical protein